MIPKDAVLELKTKLLPDGADAVIDVLLRMYERLEKTQIVVENVPLLILGRHGMIARIPTEGKISKISDADEIRQALEKFESKSNQTLYLFINLPSLSIPKELQSVLSEVQQRYEERERLRARIDAALDSRDRRRFQAAVRELRALDEGVVLHRAWSKANKRF